MRRLHYLLSLNGQELYDAAAGKDWDLAMWLAQSRRFMSHLPWWKFWPRALAKYPKFRRQQRNDHANHRSGTGPGRA